MSKPVHYMPTLRFHSLTPRYDPLLKWIMSEEGFKRQLIRQANIQPDMQVLDLGCGTGTLTLMSLVIHHLTRDQKRRRSGMFSRPETAG